MVVGVIAVFTLVNVRVVTHARVMVSVNQEILFNRRCCIATHAVEVIIRGPPDAPMTSLIIILVANKANEVW